MSTPAVTRDTGLAQFKLDLKAAMQTAGIEGTPTVFYVEDHQVSTLCPCQYSIYSIYMAEHLGNVHEMKLHAESDTTQRCCSCNITACASHSKTALA
jgi:hypothetical protein